MKKYRRNKRGSGTLFLAIILSALILVEGIYLVQMIDINRSITIDRALKLQLDGILSKYNQELFDNYGIYGFFLDDIDDEIFKKVINSTGYEYGDDVYINGYKTINTTQIRDAISTFYSYRTPGLVIERIRTIFDFAIDVLNDNGFFNNLKKFKDYGGNKVLTTISKAADKITKFLSSDELAEVLEITGKDMSLIKNFIDIFEDANDSELSFDKNFSPKDMFSMDFFNKTVELFDSYSDVINEDMFNIFLSHYSVYNFESHIKSFEISGVMTDDMNLHGTLFEELNSERCDDVEYIVTGFKDGRGTATVGYMIFPMIMIIEIANKFLDKSFMKVCETIAGIITTVLAFFLDGIKIPNWVIELIIIQYYAFFASIGQLYSLYQGKTVTVFKMEKASNALKVGIDMNYKDFAYFFTLLINPEVKLSRIEDLITDKYGEFCTSISIGTTYHDTYFTAEKGYTLYGF